MKILIFFLSKFIYNIQMFKKYFENINVFEYTKIVRVCIYINFLKYFYYDYFLFNFNHFLVLIPDYLL